LDPGTWAGVETTLADLARLHRPDELAHLAAVLIDELDQDGPPPDDTDQLVNELHLAKSRTGGGGRIKGQLDAATFDVVKRAIRATMTPAKSTDPSGLERDTSLGQRQAEALGAICEHALDDGVHAGIVLRKVFSPRVIDHVGFDRAIVRGDARVAVAAENNRAQVAGPNAIRSDDLDHGAEKLVARVGNIHAVNLGGVQQPLHVLFGYFPLADKTLIAQIGPATGDATVLRELTHGPLTTSAWAFSFWAVDFWFYTATDKGTSRVARLKTATDGSYDVAIPDTHIRIVGAGVSTCAPRAPVK